MKFVRHFLFAVVAILTLATPAYAQGMLDFILPGTFKITKIDSVISALFGLVLIIAGLLSFFNLILGGLQWIVSGGEKEALKAAQGRLLHAVVGLIIVASSWAIMLLVQDFLGFTIISKPVPIPVPF